MCYISRKKYNYKIEGETTYVYLTNKKGITHELIIDTEDLEKFLNYPYSWFTYYDYHTKTYYVRASMYQRGKAPKAIRLHRFLIDAEPSDIVDHENHNTLDDRKKNLRKTITDKNTKHRRGANSNNKSGYRNVSLIDNKYIVQLQIEGVNTVLGEFNDVDEAGLFAEEMRYKYYGDYAGNG